MTNPLDILKNVLSMFVLWRAHVQWPVGYVEWLEADE